MQRKRIKPCLFRVCLSFVCLNWPPYWIWSARLGGWLTSGSALPREAAFYSAPSCLKILQMMKTLFKNDPSTQLVMRTTFITHKLMQLKYTVAWVINLVQNLFSVWFILYYFSFLITCCCWMVTFFKLQVLFVCSHTVAEIWVKICNSISDAGRWGG